MEIANLLQLASKEYLTGNVNQWFYTLKSVKHRIISDLNKQEREELLKMEQKITTQLGYPKPDMLNHHLKEEERKKQEALYYFYKSESVKNIELYNQFLFDCMQRYGLLIKKKEDRSRIN